jgi:hypothetical protein
LEPEPNYAFALGNAEQFNIAPVRIKVRTHFV